YGASGLNIISPVATTINYGTFEPDGKIDVRLTYDHRVLDGATVARAMVALEEVLCNEIYLELKAGPVCRQDSSVGAASDLNNDAILEAAEPVAELAGPRRASF
ncbi:MAG TPA: 2-oxo acid dehydrogenase subunit E2, partial [Pirellulaceae bacterium]|nr:2-oxo acid dehydrogenase subunit E2 [Pirellulaceae bacterium]